MKLHALALSVVSVLVASHVQAAPKIYGQLNLSAESYQKDNQNPATADEDYTRLQSNSSRFGIKGEDELTATLSAVYGIEWGIDADQGTDVVTSADFAKSTTSVTNIERLTQRNRYLGLKHSNLGTLKLGKPK